MDVRTTVAVLTFNEAPHIARCLLSVRDADRLLVVDSGSTDSTCEIASALGADVIHADWPGFAAQRNRVFEHVARGRVLFMDADEWMEPGGVEKIRRTEGQGVRLSRRNYWLGQPIQYGDWGHDRPVRCVSVGHGRWEVQDEVHEFLTVRGRITDTDIVLHHDPYVGLKDHLQRARTYRQLQARSLAERGVRCPPWTPYLRGGWHVARCLAFRSGWRDGWRGLALAGIGAWHTGAKWAAVRRCASR